MGILKAYIILFSLLALTGLFIYNIQKVQEWTGAPPIILILVYAMVAMLFIIASITSAKGKESPRFASQES